MRVVDNVGFNVKKQDIPGGGSGSGSGQPLATPDYLQNDETAADYIKNRPFYRKETFTETELVTGTFTFRYNSDSHAYECSDINIPLIEGKTYKVVFDGVEYETVCQKYMDTYAYIGAVELLDYSLGAPSMPFVYAFMGVYMFGTLLTDKTHDITINEIDYDYVKLPEYYLPDERIVLKSTTSDSTKKFAITVDDSGALTATEITE